ncbi:phenylalanine--tRNA ligase subunit alpha [Aquisalinus flavus]|uniref:Phenylalanine--tRNA ligase alpha subunit n=1 Tax=Aquisalinus flavus TaxID=1526572 RepID=A0A8J2V5P1_9PROT|nr:phenylalanine--tRNA ligase subunit alpha [Aquisalinus flavus]MBD0425642.1 phenylalanine--tRNA ligase subunit alpha [Aquisalinus flavus]UNE48742.1 phenylalanine--tRNA ligase subunit alpha [Aquisalinus flavus]GGD14404.1 phenylalanine--tRNA ligase alpha subunit [Aquisalinus flavus]
MSDLDQLEKDLSDRIAAAETEAALDDVRVHALGKKGVVSERMKTLGRMSPEERQEMGPALNGLKGRIGEAIAARKAMLEEAALEARLASEKVDITLPVRPEAKGKIHPVTQVFEEMAAIFADMGFEIREGPEIEDDFHNFTALNFPPDHPARETHDTFFFNEKEDGSRKLLRTHTSPVQIRTMMTEKPPLRIIVPGRVYRCDSDQTHTPMFHQVEGLVIDRETHMGHLKGTLEAFIKAFFEIDEVTTRLRPHHFPFTEPSAEMDVGYERVGGELRIGQGEKWMEILGCGMVHPNVLRACGLDPDEYQGFAFGMGVDRLAMLKYGIPDLRDMFASDARWLEHYGFDPLDQPNTATGLSR